jgi:hypothetical protein
MGPISIHSPISGSLNSCKSRGKEGEKMKKRRLAILAGSALLGGALVSCAPEPPYYGPKKPGDTVGYTDTRLAQNRYGVTYSGNSATERETVENFLLMRSAQVTLGAGYSHFIFDTRDTKTKTTYYSSFTGWPGWPGFGWYGYTTWPYGAGAPFDVEGESRPITRFEAYAEIIMLTPAEATKEPRAIDATQIIAHLGPLVMPPPVPAKS